MIPEDNTQSHAQAWAQATMTALTRDSLAPTPENYAVYYTYFSGKDPDLKMAIDALLTEFGVLTQNQCSELYKAHIGMEAEREVLNATSATIETELKRVMGVIGKSAEGATAFNRTLDSFKGDLQTNDLSLDQLRTAVARVANETRIMAEQNQRLHSQLSQSNQQLTEMRFNLERVRKDSLLDPLTEIGNRKFFATELERCATEAAESGAPLSILMADIDFFKKFNDTFGHLVGDQVLRLVARTLIENLKGRDIIARYGGEEFVILLPQTAVNDAERVANLLRHNLSTKQVLRKKTNETLGIVTISMGATEYCPGETLDSMIARADAALYDAKQTGRNKVMVRALSEDEKRVIKQTAPQSPAPISDL